MDAKRGYAAADAKGAEQRILAALQGLRFGSVEIQVHDSRIVRITRTEKVRVEEDGSKEDIDGK
jgi:hypothetical protein